MRKFYILFLFILAFACNRDKTIPERQLVKILAEMHLADATFEESGTLRWDNRQRDSTAVYVPILNDYGYTVEELYSSMKKHSRTKEDVDKLYDKVYKRLAKLQKKYAKEVAKLYKQQNRWIQKADWRFPNDGDTLRLPFDIAVNDSMGSYILTADIMLLPTDSVSNPRMTMCLYTQVCHQDSVLRDSVYADTTICADSLLTTLDQPLVRDGNELNYSITLVNTSAHATRVEGYILNCDSDSLALKPRYATVRNIMLRYVSPTEFASKSEGKKLRLSKQDLNFTHQQ